MRGLQCAMCVALLCCGLVLPVVRAQEDAAPAVPEADVVAAPDVAAADDPVDGTPEVAESVTAELAELANDAALNSQIKEAEEAQAFHEEAQGEVISNIITEAEPAALASGDGDVSTTGPCSGDIDHFCGAVKPGEGRLFECLSQQQQAEELGNVQGRTIIVECLIDMAVFSIERSKNINLDVPLARYCKKDVKKFCRAEKKSKDPAAILNCLKQHDAELSEKCGDEVFRVELLAADDFRTDASLNQYCQEDAATHCPDVEPGDGRMQDCLRDNQHKLKWECQEDLFRQDVQNADDIRLSIRLLRVCMQDKQTFCAHVPYGNAQVKECLEENRMQDGFTLECQVELENMMARRAADFRLDRRLADACALDIEETCGRQAGSMQDVEGSDGRVLECLQDFRDELKVPECEEQVHRVTSRASQDLRFDLPLAVACSNDRQQFCADVQQGSARVIRCLQEHREEVGYECRSALFDQEVRMAEDIDFKFPMKQLCSAEISNFCGDMPHGHARIIRCLQEHLEDEGMGPDCRAQVEEDEIRSSQDYRLNWRLNQACEGDLQQLCSDVCSASSGHACGGLALRCLQDNQDQIVSDECQKEVLYFEMMEVDDFRNDVLLAEACRTDVDKYCKNVEPGEGRVIECLRNNREKLTEACRKEELTLNIIQARDVRLRPKLRKTCSQEIATFCSNTKPGKGRVFQCLEEHLAEPDFGSPCREQMEERMDIMQSDYRLDYGVSTACEGDVAGFCADAKGRAHGKAEVMKCLVQFHEELTGQCEAETSRAARMALWEYKKGNALTEECDEDVARYCVAERHKSRGVWSIGAVGRCLSKQLALGSRMREGCQDLVRAAAPRDSRAVIDAKSAAAMLASKLRQVQRAAQTAAQTNAALVNAKLVDPEGEGTSIITLTGWVAAAGIAAAVILVAVGAVWGVRKLLGRDQPYTLVRPRDGDV